jgi:dolichol-phosphate mannosyltransferase
MRLPEDIPAMIEERERDAHAAPNKLSLRKQLEALRHFRQLYIHRYGTWAHLAQFLVVGATGLAVNLILLTLFVALHIRHELAILLAIALSMVWNFALNRRFSFSYARLQSALHQFAGFVAACSVGACVNYVTTSALWDVVRYKQLAAALGVLAGTAFNFLASRYLVFRWRRVTPEGVEPPGRERGAAPRA